MYFNDVNIGFYILISIIGIFVGEFTNWMNKRLLEEKNIFSKDIFKEYKKRFAPNYIVIILTSVIYIFLLYNFGIKSTFIENLDLIKYLILTPMLISVFVVDYKIQIIPNRLNLTLFEVGIIFTFIYGLSNIAISINMLLGMLAGVGIFLVITLLGGFLYGKKAMGLRRCETYGSFRFIFWINKYNYYSLTFLFNRCYS